VEQQNAEQQNVEQQNRSWLRLIGFFAVTTLAWSLALAAVLAGATVVVAGGESSPTPEDQVGQHLPSQYSGVITDAHCGPKHSDSGKGASECARMCVRNGSRYTIVDGDKKYEVVGNVAEFDEFAGQRVNLIAQLHGNTLKVISISPPAIAEKQ